MGIIGRVHDTDDNGRHLPVCTIGKASVVINRGQGHGRTVHGSCIAGCRPAEWVVRRCCHRWVFRAADVRRFNAQVRYAGFSDRPRWVPGAQPTCRTQPAGWVDVGALSDQVNPGVMLVFVKEGSLCPAPPPV